LYGRTNRQRPITAGARLNPSIYQSRAYNSRTQGNRYANRNIRYLGSQHPQWRQIFQLGGNKLALVPGVGSSSSDVSFDSSSQSGEGWRNIFTFGRAQITLFPETGSRQSKQVYNIGKGRLMLGGSASGSGLYSSDLSD